MAANETSGQRPVLVVAAETIAAGGGGAQTVIDVLQARALRQYAPELAKYFARELGGDGDIRAALDEVRAVVAACDPGSLAQAPGVRARVFRFSAEAVSRRIAAGHAPPPPRWKHPSDGPEASPFGRVRAALDAPTRHLAALRFVHRLATEEIAVVLNLASQDVDSRLDDVLHQARTVLGQNPENAAVALEQALALDDANSPQVSLRDEPWDALPQGLLIGGRYAIDARVGSGACADVYHAHDNQVPGHTVALKLLHLPSLSETARQEALRELRLIASVFHPSVVQFKDHGWHEGRLWFVMPWCEGETLDARIRRSPLSRREARRIFEPLARALAALHGAGIRHQDVKPSNVLLAKMPGLGATGAGDVLPILIDLGVAAKEAEMVVAGTPTYFAPEVAAQFASIKIVHRVGPKADVFSLALALRNALEPGTADAAPPEGGVEKFIERRAHNVPPLPESRDLAYLEPVFRRWLSLVPAERPTAAKLADELAVLTEPEERAQRRKAVLRWVAPVGIGLAIAFGAAVSTLSRQTLRARMDAAEARADLSSANAQRAALEKRVGQIRSSYEQSRLSRQELTRALGSAEGRLEQALRDITAESERVSSLRERLAHSQALAAETAQRLAAAENGVATARSQLATELERGDHARQQLGQAQEARRAAEARIDEVEASLGTLRTQIVAERAKSDVLEREIASAEAARTRAEGELARLRREMRPPGDSDIAAPPADEPTSEGTSAPAQNAAPRPDPA